MYCKTGFYPGTRTEPAPSDCRMASSSLLRRWQRNAGPVDGPEAEPIVLMVSSGSSSWTTGGPAGTRDVVHTEYGGGSGQSAKLGGGLARRGKVHAGYAQSVLVSGLTRGPRFQNALNLTTGGAMSLRHTPVRRPANSRVLREPRAGEVEVRVRSAETIRVAVGGISHETNTFCPEPATIPGFRDYMWLHGGEIPEALAGTRPTSAACSRPPTTWAGT